jgi:serine/threonine protein kinase
MPEFDFAHYHIFEEVGRGGMAIVYGAIDTRTEQTVALKILYPHLMKDELNVKRFQREALVVSRLKHKFIVPFIEYGVHNNQTYIATQYMLGNSLATLLNTPCSLKVKAIVRVLSEIASALDYAHGQGVIHRDLKLQNILLDEERHAYLSDFGIARLVDGTRLTATGQIAGTPMYMSPEHIRGQTVDFRSDIYSFAVMSYLMLTGFYPFTGEDSLTIIHQHVKRFPPTPTEVNNELPETANLALLRGLMKHPDNRYQTAMEMVEDLHNALNAPELNETSTYIDVRKINPIDSAMVDMIHEYTPK